MNLKIDLANLAIFNLLKWIPSKLSELSSPTCWRCLSPPKMSMSPLKFTLQDRNTSVRSPSLKFKFKLTSPLSVMRRGVLFGSAVFNTKNDRSQYRLEQLSKQPAGQSIPHGQPWIIKMVVLLKVPLVLFMELTIFACDVISIAIWNAWWNTTT